MDGETPALVFFRTIRHGTARHGTARSGTAEDRGVGRCEWGRPDGWAPYTAGHVLNGSIAVDLTDFIAVTSL